MILELVSQQADASELMIVANSSVIPYYGRDEANKFSISCGSRTKVESKAGFVCDAASQVFIINHRAICGK